MAESLHKVKDNMHAWVIELTERGEFKGHQAARTVFDFYMQHMIVFDNHTLRRSKNYVLEGVVSPRIVAQKTGLSEKWVRQANKWLAERKLIVIQYKTGEKYQYVSGIKIFGLPENEELRQDMLAQEQKPGRNIKPRVPRDLQRAVEDVYSELSTERSELSTERSELSTDIER